MIRPRALGIAVVSAIALAACATTTPSSMPTTVSSAPAADPSGTPAPSAIACAPDARLAVLPEWAREGFSEPEPSAVHALGRSGEIVAILFGGTLYSPPSAEVSNKILWVARGPVDAGPLVMSAQRMDGTATVGKPVERTVPDGPGPSTIDLPDAGCWRLSLSWAGGTDSLDLDYLAPSGSTQRLART